MLSSRPDGVHDVRLDGGLPGADEHIPVGLLGLDRLQEAAPLQGLDVHLDADLAQLVLHVTAISSRVLLVFGPVDQLELELLAVLVEHLAVFEGVAGLGELGQSLLGVVLVARHVGIVDPRGLGIDRAQRLGLPQHDLVGEQLLVDGVVDAVAHVDVVGGEALARCSGRCSSRPAAAGHHS